MIIKPHLLRTCGANQIHSLFLCSVGLTLKFVAKESTVSLV